MKSTTPLLPLIFSAFACTVGCAHHAQNAPALSNPDTPTTTQPAPQKNFFSRTADATWEVVSAPVRMATQKKPPAPEPETYQAPEAVIIVPQAEGGEGLLGVATQPATTLPK